MTRIHAIYVISIMFLVMNRALCCLILAPPERMVVRCGPRSRDGHRCLCACSFRLSVSSSVSLPILTLEKKMHNLFPTI